MLLYAISFLTFLRDLFHPLTGPSDAHQGGYLFWSGIGGSFILGGGIWTAALVAYRKHNCHARWCMRIGRHPAAGGKYMLCHRHHPDVPDCKPSAEEIQAEHLKPTVGATTSDGTW